MNIPWLNFSEIQVKERNVNGVGSETVDGDEKYHQFLEFVKYEARNQPKTAFDGAKNDR